MKHFFKITAATLCLATMSMTATAGSCPDGLPRTQGYWNNHADAWPTDVVSVGDRDLGRDWAIENVLAEPSRGDAVKILLKQLISAKLNIAAGVSGAAVQSYIDDADALLMTYWIGDAVDKDTRKDMLDIKDRLDEFNNGAFCELPVELTTFDARTDGNAVTLRWSTSSETMNAGFYVEHRRGAGYGFESLSFVSGSGDSQFVNNYEVSLSNLGFGTHTFRLRQIDLDGSFSYSGEVEIDVDLTDSFALAEAYPNPFNPTTNIRFSLRESGDVHLAVYDLTGRHVRTLASGPFAAGSHDVAFSADNLPSGTYLYRLQTVSGPVSGSIVLLK